MWQWQPVHRRLSIDVALRNFCCQALCSSVSVTGYCVVICVPIFLVCASAVNTFLCVQKLCVPMFLSDHQVSMCFLCLERGKKRKRKVAPILITQHSPSLACKKDLSLRTSQTQQLNSILTLHCHGHIFFRRLHCLDSGLLTFSSIKEITATKMEIKWTPLLPCILRY